MRFYREQACSTACSNAQSFAIDAVGERNQPGRDSLCLGQYHDAAPILLDHVRNPDSRANQHWNARAKRFDCSDTKTLIRRRNGEHVRLLQKPLPLFPRQEAEPSNAVLYVKFPRSLVKCIDICRDATTRHMKFVTLVKVRESVNYRFEVLLRVEAREEPNNNALSCGPRSTRFREAPDGVRHDRRVTAGVICAVDLLETRCDDNSVERAHKDKSPDALY